MTVAFDAFTGDAGTGQNLTISHTPVGTPRAVIALMVIVNAGLDNVTGVTYGGVAMTEVAGSPVLKGTGEIGSVYAYFLGASVPTGVQDCIFTLGSSHIRVGAVITLTAGNDVEVIDSDGTINSDSLENPSVILGLGGRASFAALALVSGQDDVTGITPLTDWTSRREDDAGVQVGGIYTYDIIDTVDVTAGWTQTAEDAIAIAVAVAEVVGAGGQFAVSGSDGVILGDAVAQLALRFNIPDEGLIFGDSALAGVITPPDQFTVQGFDGILFGDSATAILESPSIPGVGGGVISTIAITKIRRVQG